MDALSTWGGMDILSFWCPWSVVNSFCLFKFAPLTLNFACTINILFCAKKTSSRATINASVWAINSFRFANPYWLSTYNIKYWIILKCIKNFHLFVRHIVAKYDSCNNPSKTFVLSDVIVLFNVVSLIIKH